MAQYNQPSKREIAARRQDVVRVFDKFLLDRSRFDGPDLVLSAVAIPENHSREVECLTGGAQIATLVMLDNYVEGQSGVNMANRGFDAADSAVRETRDRLLGVPAEGEPRVKDPDWFRLAIVWFRLGTKWARDNRPVLTVV